VERGDVGQWLVVSGQFLAGLRKLPRLLFGLATCVDGPKWGWHPV
jgi:hypothetical protein